MFLKIKCHADFAIDSPIIKKLKTQIILLTLIENLCNIDDRKFFNASSAYCPEMNLLSGSVFLSIFKTQGFVALFSAACGLFFQASMRGKRG
jgi:hypothetical protein